MSPDETTTQDASSTSASADFVSQPFQKTSPRSDHPPLKAFLETTGKLLVGIAGLCYVTGLLVVTIHLRRYGLNSLILSQLHYVMAGVWAWIPIVFAMFLTTTAINSVIMELDGNEKPPDTEDTKTPEKNDKSAGRLYKIIRWFSQVCGRRNRKIAKTFLLSLGVMSFVLWMLLGYAGIRLGWSWLIVVPVGAFVALFLFGVGYGLIRTSFYKDFESLTLTAGAAFFGLLFFFGYLILFAKLAYQDIPWSTGGGGSSQVELLVATDAKPQLESVGIKFSAGENRTDSLTLLLATEKEYIVINPSGKAISIPADSVKSVVYEK